jgi:hypothetical protein
MIALGRAQATAWRYSDAIETYTRGIKVAPANAMLYRHRGHRYISTRQFDKAVTDLIWRLQPWDTASAIGTCTMAIG